MNRSKKSKRSRNTKTTTTTTRSRLTSKKHKRSKSSGTLSTALAIGVLTALAGYSGLSYYRSIKEKKTPKLPDTLSVSNFKYTLEESEIFDGRSFINKYVCDFFNYIHTYIVHTAPDHVLTKSKYSFRKESSKDALSGAFGSFLVYRCMLDYNLPYVNRPTTYILVDDIHDNFFEYTDDEIRYKHTKYRISDYEIFINMFISTISKQHVGEKISEIPKNYRLTRISKIYPYFDETTPVRESMARSYSIINQICPEFGKSGNLVITDPPSLFYKNPVIPGLDTDYMPMCPRI